MISYYKSLINVKAYLPDDQEIIHIIRLCKLRNDINNWKIWYDDLGNKLEIVNKNKIIIKHYNNKKIIKDIHYKLHPKHIIKKSSVLLINKIDNIVYCLFLCDDNFYLSIMNKNIWQENSAPLNVGIGNIRLLIKNANIKKHKEINDNTIIVRALSRDDCDNVIYKQIIESLK